MTRTDIINLLINKNNYKSYLEIGTSNPFANYHSINCQYKECVDPVPFNDDITFKGTSDEYFDSITKDKKFDIIFIDGLHHNEQVTKDIKNSLEHLNDNGIIVIHDCLPYTEMMQFRHPEGGFWTGDVWKAIAKLRMTSDDIDIKVVDTDFGCGLIKKGTNVKYPSVNDSEMTYQYYLNNRDKLMNVISIDSFNKIYLTVNNKNELTIHDNEIWKDHVFVIDSWTDNESKENDLINLIKKLKTLNIDIVLSGHYPVKPEIQKMVDYYLFDKENDLLKYEEFDEYGVDSGRWTEYSTFIVSNRYEFHHDYAIWQTMRHSFNFCKYLNKKYIHFFEYDNNPDIFQYRQSFIEKIENHDAILYEYHKNSVKDPNLNPYCATFIFSIKTDVAIKMIDLIKTKREYFTNRPRGWQLERIFLDTLKQVTNNIKISDYIANNNELNTQAVWNRDGMIRNNTMLQIYLAGDVDNNLFIHLISGFHEKKSNSDYLLEIIYNDVKKFLLLKKGEMITDLLGKYILNESVKVYYQGVEIYNEKLNKSYKDFFNLNSIVYKDNVKNRVDKINYNFIDGAYFEIIGEGDETYDVKIYDNKKNIILYQTKLKNNHWCRTDKKYFIDYRIEITSNTYNNTIYYDCSKKRVFINFDSKSLGDNIAWIPYVEKFRKDKDCHVICSTFHNSLFKECYPDLEFVEPGSIVSDIYAQYKLGLFKKDNETNYNMHPNNPLHEPLTKIASDILGLDYKEIRTKITNNVVNKKKIVTIGVHSTAQCKYWNNPNGWQDVVDYLNDRGYTVKLMSREEDGYMGNRNPTGVVRHQPGSLKDVIKAIQESELFIGISSGLSWISWATGTPTILISGFTDDYCEPTNGIIRVINKSVCHGCWHTHNFDAGDWNWCPIHKGTDKQFECSKQISSSDVIKEIEKVLV